MSLQAASSIASGVAVSGKLDVDKTTESKTNTIVKRASISAAPTTGEQDQALKAQACADIRLVTRYLCRRPELFGLPPIQLPKDLGSARALEITPDGNRYIVKIEKYSCEERFHGKPLSKT